MKFIKYLQDKIYAILFYIVTMTFVSLVVYLDNSRRIGLDNLIYMNCVAMVFFMIYLGLGYIRHKRYYDSILYVVRNNRENILSSLPKPYTYEQQLYREMLENIYDEQSKKIDRLYEEKKENLEFITSWVHEIKTPIAASRLIIENDSGKSQEDILSSFEDEINKIENFVEQALYYSRVDAFSKDYLINEVQLRKVVNEVVKKNAKTFINKHIKLEIRNLDMEILTDIKWLHFIIQQVLINALKYTGENGTIKIYGIMQKGEKQLVIEDNGIGIKSEDIYRIFDKGFTGYNGRNNYSATGMGLYLAQKLAEKLGHKISGESVYGEYTKVTIHFPKLIDYFNVTKM